jgi:hypothetical protein
MAVEGVGWAGGRTDGRTDGETTANGTEGSRTDGYSTLGSERR